MGSRYYPWQFGEVHYVKRGLGDPLLLVHNVYPGASHEEFEHNLDALARCRTVYAIDLLGFGASDAPRMKYTASTYVRLISDFVADEIGAAGAGSRPADVVSAGLSCAYVSEAAVWRPDLFGRLAFVCPRSEPTGLDMPRWVAAIQHLFLTTPPLGNGYYETLAGDHELTTYLRNCFHNPDKHVTPAKVQRLVEHARRKGTIYPYASLVTGYLDRSLLATLPKVDKPVLLVWGRQARPTPVEHSVRLVALGRHTRLEVVEDAGSWVHDEQSAKVNKLLVDYLTAENVFPARRDGAVSA
jgi:pimeloyl-ACP methyl ester carboxylesterase